MEEMMCEVCLKAVEEHSGMTGRGRWRMYFYKRIQNRQKHKILNGLTCLENHKEFGISRIEYEVGAEG